jgi:hypothetical protein
VQGKSPLEWPSQTFSKLTTICEVSHQVSSYNKRGRPRTRLAVSLPQVSHPSGPISVRLESQSLREGGWLREVAERMYFVERSLFSFSSILLVLTKESSDKGLPLIEQALGMKPHLSMSTVWGGGMDCWKGKRNGLWGRIGWSSACIYYLIRHTITLSKVSACLCFFPFQAVYFSSPRSGGPLATSLKRGSCSALFKSMLLPRELRSRDPCTGTHVPPPPSFMHYKILNLMCCGSVVWGLNWWWWFGYLSGPVVMVGWYDVLLSKLFVV